MIQKSGQRSNLGGVGFKPNGIVASINIDVSLNATLRVEHESVAAGILIQVADEICDHAIQPAHTIFAGTANQPPPSQIVDSDVVQ